MAYPKKFRSKWLATCLSAVLLAASPAFATDIYVQSELVVGLEEGYNIDTINELFETVEVQYLAQLDVHLLNTMAGQDIDSLAAAIAEMQGVAFAHPNYIVDPMEPVQGSIPFGDENFVGSYAEQQAAQILNLNDAHNVATGSQVKVGIIDGGVNYLHPVLSSTATSGWDYVDDDFDAMDDSGGVNTGHGTFVAGVVHLVAPSAKIRSYRVTNTQGQSDGWLVAEAILQAVEDSCRIINISLVIMDEHDAVRDAIAYARNHDVLVVAAAGNAHNGLPEYPASDINTLAVAAVDSTMTLADFSNFGSYVDVCAPGVNIYSPYIDTSYAWWGGTSFAAPFVTAEAALILSLEPDLTWEEIRDAILATAEPIDDINPAYAGLLGAGIIDPLGALMQLIGSGISLQVPEQYATITEAIAAAAHGDTILVGPGTYYDYINFVGKTLKLISSDGPEVTILRPRSLVSNIVFMSGTYLPGCEINGFTFTGTGSQAAIRTYSAQLLIQNNIFRDNHMIPNGNTTYSVIECEAPGSIIRNNLFYNNPAYCIKRDPGVKVINNTFDNNWRAFEQYDTDGVREAINNIVTNSTSYGIYGNTRADQNDIAYNDVWNNYHDYATSGAADSTSISADPLYLDPANGDYRIIPGSPCIDAGSPDPQYNDPDGSRNDIGARPVGTLAAPLAKNKRVTPVGSGDIVTALNPEFHWSFYDADGYSQIVAQVMVGTDPDWIDPVHWNSGSMITSDTSVIMGGAPLADLTRYYVRIRVQSTPPYWGDWTGFSFVTSAATVINVPGDKPTIQEAVDIANEGDTVLIAAGMYVSTAQRIRH